MSRPCSPWAVPRPDLTCGEVYLSQKERDGREGKRPAVLVVEIGLCVLGPVEHLVVDAGDVEHQAHHQREACGKARGAW